MSTLVFCLEEPSARAMLQGLLPRLLPPGVQVQYIVFEGKQDMHKRLTHRLKHWLAPDSCFVVLRDQDSSDCRLLKQELRLLCEAAGRSQALVRIACHELETFYLGDLAAVEQGLELRGLAKQQASSKFKTPDRLANPAEELDKLTKSRYQKLAGSRAIGPHLRIDGRNTSASFCALIDGLKRLSI
ncbi:DUF4276 family protein [Sphaerotilus uruguayifluvii]|uniref:DUF4276 family protein n=1 Tax=Sphaerotilus uruguayifluvii TaxID=2735897 RepID=A0ABX2GA72_9BURK|nr:DUF4276 family protein [Leptothrix sp. C29]NRT58385.1 hypothetical protein [Leptothrix sp. C29]